MADGDVVFGGGITLRGLVPDQFALTAEGTRLGLRFPAGFRSTVNPKLSLTGPVGGPTLSGDVNVLRSTYLPEIDSQQALLGLAAMGGGGISQGPTPTDDTLPLRLNISVSAPPGAFRIDGGANTQVFGSIPDLKVTGTIDAPVVTGLVTIDRGFVMFNGNRWTFQPSSVEFYNPSRIQPFFDITFLTRARVTSEAYDVTTRITREPAQLSFDIHSDPPLPQNDLFLVLLGQQPTTSTSAEVRDIQSPQLSQQQAMRTMAAPLVTMPISARIGSVVQRTIPFDTFSIVPLLGNEAAVSTSTAGARVTLGKRVSDNVFLTYSRALNASGLYTIVLIEYEQSERVSWVLSRNEDRTYALDFRIRHVF